LHNITVGIFRIMHPTEGSTITLSQTCNNKTVDSTAEQSKNCKQYKYLSFCIYVCF